MILSNCTRRVAAAAFNGAVKPWLIHLGARGHSPNTLEAYAYSLRRFSVFLRARRGRLGIHDVGLGDLEAWRQDLTARQLSPETCDHYLRPLKGYFGWLEREGVLFVTPSRDFQLVRFPRRLLSALTEAQMARVIDSVPLGTAVEQRDRALLETAYSSGLRLGEIAKLDVEAVDLEARLVRVVGKGSKERSVPLTAAAVSALKHYLLNGRRELLRGRSNERALWIQLIRPERLNRWTIGDLIRKRSRAVGVPLSPHGIRRAFATHLLRRGASPAHLLALLGHAGYRSLVHYLRHVPQDLIATHRRSRLGR